MRLRKNINKYLENSEMLGLSFVHPLIYTQLQDRHLFQNFQRVELDHFQLLKKQGFLQRVSGS